MARIVIIEDNAHNLSLMTYLLSASGHATEGWGDGQSGLDAVRRAPPDLVLCDIQLPHLSGYEIATALRDDPALRTLPLVAVSALAMRGDRERALAAGFQGYIEKPVQPETFVEQVEAYLAQRLRRGPPLADHRTTEISVLEASESAARAVILVVDDVEGDLALMQAILSAAFRVVIARDIPAALVRMRREPPDLVISDLHFPDGSGFDLRRKAMVDPALCGIPFLFVSTTAVRDEERNEARRLGVFEFVEQPVEPQRLLQGVQACLARGMVRAPRTP
ncbi:MAG TPA: response regulator [Verrucomicrobiae bacterium]|nr:response regulator [Verrucomicrobiae bacterium]